jgi:hypothetical protein
VQFDMLKPMLAFNVYAFALQLGILHNLKIFAKTAPSKLICGLPLSVKIIVLLLFMFVRLFEPTTGTFLKIWPRTLDKLLNVDFIEFKMQLNLCYPGLRTSARATSAAMVRRPSNKLNTFVIFKQVSQLTLLNLFKIAIARKRTVWMSNR